MSKEFKGVWIDGALWESKDFKLIEKHLLQKIKDLDNDKGCTAMNGWFAEFLGVSKSRVSQLISKFKDKKLISVKLKYQGKEVAGRVIRILKGGMLYFKGGVSEINRPLSYSKDPPLIYCEESNIVLSNRVSNLEESIKGKNSHIKNLELEIESLKAKLSEAEKERKSSAKKKEAETPLTEEEFLKQHGFDYIPQFEITLTNYPYRGWSENLKDIFTRYCVSREKKEKEKNPRYSYNESQVKENIRMIETCLVDFGLNITELAVAEAISPAWTKFFPKRIKNELEREKIKNEKRNQQKSNNGQSIYDNLEQQLGINRSENEHEDSDNTIDVDWEEEQY